MSYPNLAKYLEKKGLYEPKFEHDNCGVGFIASYKGEKSHRIVKAGLKAASCLTHRGAISADKKTGDGAGISIQIPQELFWDYIEDMGYPRPKENIGVGMVFLPDGNIKQQDACRVLVEKTLIGHHLKFYSWRTVPINSNILGPMAKKSCPRIEQFLIKKPEEKNEDEF